MTPAQHAQFVQQLSQGIGYAGTTSEPEVRRLEDTAEPLTISYNYKRDKAGDWDNLKIVPQLAPIFLPQLDEKEPPVQTILLGVPRVETSTSSMKLPDGWGVELPEAIHQRSAYATYDETYRFEKGTLYVERRIEVLKQKVPVSDWKSYKKWGDAADLAHDQWVQLVTNDKSEAKEEDKSSPPTKVTSDAGKLIEDAHTALQMHTFDQAKSLLDQAKQLDSKRPFLWANYGDLEMGLGKTSAAIDGYKEELSLYPDHYGIYERLALAQTQAGLREDAKQTLRKWAAADVHNPLPPSRLARMLLEDGDAEGATAVAESGMQGLPEGRRDEHLELLLGRAELMAGKADQGRATLLVLMQTTKSPEMMNDSAYELANAKLELPLAESAARTALAKMADESKRWTLDRGLEILITNSRQIVATWDTLGWILYQEGKNEEAEGYLKAAWLNRQSKTIAQHFGEVCEARGNKHEALTVFELGLATIPPRDSLDAKKDPGIEEKKMQSRADALRKDGAKSASHDARSTLQAMRTFSLGPAKGVDGVAEYRLLVNKNKIVGTTPRWGKELPDGDGKLKMARLTGFTPPDYEANLVRTGMLNCHSGVCELVLEP
jgi:tetratricopeptide (TPR) repeat protein